MLLKNRRLNNNRFQAKRLAVSSREEQEVSIVVDPLSISNPGASVIDPDDSSSTRPVEFVSTTTIDALWKREFDFGSPMVVKLDVEGMEIQALMGGEDAVKGGCLVIFEDHGSDDECEVTKYFLGKDLDVFCYQKDRLRRVRCVDDVRAIKSQKAIGYNFFAFHEDSHFSSVFKGS
jgi:FkbM family methyltransferase